MQIIDRIDGCEVGLEWREGRQVILLRCEGPASPVALGLGALLGARYVERQGATWAEIVHDERVDRLLVELVDLFAELRVRHPRMMQLTLAFEGPFEALAGGDDV